MLKTGLIAIMGVIILKTGAIAQVYVKNTGNVGIGVANPNAKLELPNSGPASFRVGVTTNMANFHTQLINSLAVVGENSTSTPMSGAVSYDFYNNGNSPTWSGSLLVHYGNGFGTGETQWGVPKRNLGVLHFQNESNGLIVASEKVFVMPGYTGNPTIFHQNGNVSIGYATSQNPGQRLEVNGTVRASNFLAHSGNNYPDYVFDSTYKLPTLLQVEAYIKQNHHLPEVPTEAEVKKDGIDLAAHQVILLKKVEELTLYAIEQNKKIQQLENKMAEVMEVNNKLKEELMDGKAKKKLRSQK